MASSWRPTYRGDGRGLTVTSGGKQIWVGIVDSQIDAGSMSTVSALTLERMLEDMPLPWPTPGLDRTTNPAAFGHWWRMIHYGADPPDPYTVPALPTVLASDDQERLDRFVETAGHLAASSLLNSGTSVTIHSAEGGRYTRHETDFPAKDVEAGFSTLLRQCDDPDEKASYHRVKNALAQVCRAATDAEATSRSERVEGWGKVVKLLHRKSADQLVRDRLVRDEGLNVFAYEEEYLPRQLLQMYQYGDLVHWGGSKDSVHVEGSPFAADWQRESFFRAAAGIAHLYIGFAELAKAITP